MKKFVSFFLAWLIFVFTLCPSAFALKGEVVNPEELPFVMNDSSSSSWAEAEVTAAQRAGLIPKLTGNPGFQDKITREQFAELALQLVKAVYGKSADMSQAKSFSDCTNSAVLEASAFGIVEGSDGKFDPKNTSDRQQIATMLSRSIVALNNLTGKNAAPKAGSVESFSDKDSIASWAKTGVGILAANGIMQGSGGRVMPADPCTVEQCILMCYRVYTTCQTAA